MFMQSVHRGRLKLWELVLGGLVLGSERQLFEWVRSRYGFG